MSKSKKLSVRNVLRTIKNEVHLIWLIVICIVLLFVSIIVGVSHVRRIYDVFGQTSYDYIFDRAEVTSGNFSADFKKKGVRVEVEANILSETEKINKDEVRATLRALENSGEFNKARYISMRGIKYLSNGGMSYVDTDVYEKLIDFSNGYSVFKDIDGPDGACELCFAAPVAYNGIVQGYVVGSLKATQMFETFDNESSTSVAERYLVDDKGDIVLYTKGDNIYDGSGKNIYDVLTKDCIDDYDAEITKESIRNNLVTDRMMHSLVSVGGDEGYALFKELQDSDGWSIFYIVYDKNVKALINPVLVETVISILLIALCVMSMAIAIMRYLSREQKRVFELAYVDELTSAPNENAFKERARTLIDDNPDEAYAIVCFDILNFRYINEGYGHEKADILLRSISEYLEEALSYNECYGRIGADRFVGLWIDDGRLEERKTFMHEKLKKKSESIMIKYPIRFKLGIYYVSNKKEAIADMIDKAELARKSVNGDDRILQAEYREQLMESTRRQENIESQMHPALENHEFVPYLQPKWDMENDHICGAEALVRWKKADGSIVPPGDFIPLFEKNGFVEKVDFYMLEEVCKYVRRMIDEGRAVYPVSINQSRYLMYDPEYINRVQEIFLKYKVPKGLVELELTETVFFNEKDRMVKVMNELKNLNVGLSIDDFGSGYSSLNLLRDIPFDVLKIDREFLDESGQSESGKWILRKIVEMAEGLNLRVICEGVETREQVDMLLDIGCKYAQGFLYSRPIPMEEYIEKYDHVM